MRGQSIKNTSKHLCNPTLTIKPLTRSTTTSDFCCRIDCIDSHKSHSTIGPQVCCLSTKTLSFIQSLQVPLPEPWKKWLEKPCSMLSLVDTVDGRNPATQLRLVVYPIIYKVLYTPGGAGFRKNHTPLAREAANTFLIHTFRSSGASREFLSHVPAMIRLGGFNPSEKYLSNWTVKI